MSDWEKFKELHQDKPNIYKEFVDITNTLIKRGYSRYSAYGVMHVVRFQTGASMKPEMAFKISNNMTPFYARLYQRDYPMHIGFFQTKVIQKEQFQEDWIQEVV